MSAAAVTSVALSAQRLKPAVRSHGGLAQRVALAVLGAVLHSSCS